MLCKWHFGGQYSSADYRALLKWRNLRGSMPTEVAATIMTVWKTSYIR